MVMTNMLYDLYPYYQCTVYIMSWVCVQCSHPQPQLGELPSLLSANQVSYQFACFVPTFLSEYYQGLIDSFIGYE